MKKLSTLIFLVLLSFKLDIGVYAVSNGATNYANTHAVTSIGSIAYTYDQNGNMLTETGGLTNTWDYTNRLTETEKNSITTTYTYNLAGQRVKVDNGTTTTVYPNKVYNTNGTTPTKHIYAATDLIMTLEGTGGSAVAYTTHTDHLTGSQVVSNSSGSIEQLFDYYPFGNVRIDNQTNSFSEKHQYAGSILDTDTGLNYMNARYYESEVGRFVTQDPVARDIPETFLSDPQQLNYYAYARNNPMRFIDPLGLYNTETGEIEEGDTKDSITESINTTFGINTNWETIKDVSFYNDRFGDKELNQLTGESLRIGTNVTKDITKQLDKLNKNRGIVGMLFGNITLLNFAPYNIWDIKNSNDPILGVGDNGERSVWSYIYHGKLVRYDAPGNINYGYVARAVGFSAVEIQSGAILEQIVDDALKGRDITFGDNSGDAKYIQMGINRYNNRTRK